ncbi:hypothetical protein L2E82_21141 [Cichorium intybus]|uniref:Uncharacterized protein n=1 Tax=Cichorium intybus TaxID=13427 RepID=A0ACB9DVB7_CICIN|nr:hypothetical protein L2E82_21141 [Cichorium intybus]
MASEITEEDDEDSYFLHNIDAQKEKIRRLIKHQKNLYQSSSSSSSSYYSSSTGVTARSSCSSFDRNRSKRLLNLMKKGSTSLRRLFDMEHTSLANHFDFYSCSPETKTIPLWGSDSDDAFHDDPWMGITKLANRTIQQHHEIEKHQEYEEQKEYVLGNQKLARKKSLRKLPSFYKFRFRFPFRFRLKPRLRFCSWVWRGKKKT